MHKKYHIVYKTTNLLNNKCYVGVHSTNKIEDGYMGCGFYKGYTLETIKNKRGIRKAFKKYGLENFNRETLFVFDNKEEAYKKEAEIVNYDWVLSNSNYNLCLGGVSSGVTILPEDHKNKLTDLHSKSYVVVNIKTSEVFFVKNLNSWSRDKGLCSASTTNSPLHIVISGKIALYKKEWWCCYEEDWTGEPIIKKRKISVRPSGYERKKCAKKHNDVTLIDPNGKSIYIENLYKFCIDNNMCYSNMLKVKKGLIKSYKKYKSPFFKNLLK